MTRKQWKALQSLLGSPEKLYALWQGLQEQSLPWVLEEPTMTEQTTHPPGVVFDLNQRVIYTGTDPRIKNDSRVQYSGRVSQFSDQHPDEVAVHWGPEESFFRWERREDLSALPCTVQVVVGEGAPETWFETGRTLRQIRLAVNALSFFKIEICAQTIEAVIEELDQILCEAEEARAANSNPHNKYEDMAAWLKNETVGDAYFHDVVSRRIRELHQQLKQSLESRAEPQEVPEKGQASYLQVGHFINALKLPHDWGYIHAALRRDFNLPEETEVLFTPDAENLEIVDSTKYAKDWFECRLISHHSGEATFRAKHRTADWMTQALQTHLADSTC